MKKNIRKSQGGRFIKNRHIGEEIFFHSPDFLFLISLLIIIFFGFWVLIPASFSKGCSLGDCYFYLHHQLIFGFLPGLVLFFVFYFFDYHKLKKIAVPFLIISFILLVLVFVPPFGVSYKGASRWINLGIINLQPSEIIKIAVIIYLSAWLSYENGKENLLKSWKNVFLPFILLLFLVFILLIAEPDMSTLLVVGFTMVAIYFLANVPWYFLFISFISLISASLIFIKLSPYRLSRVISFLHPQIDPQGINYHAIEALEALSSGGFLGKGLSQSSARFLPEVLSDSIFVLAAEGLGFIGGVIIIFFYFFLFWRCFYIARKAPDKFGYLLASGIGFSFIISVIINLGAMTGLLPLTGIPLPLMSYGGTSMAITLASFGILANISRQTITN